MEVRSRSLFSPVSLRSLRCDACPAPHFKSWHGKFGIVTGVLLLSQALIGALIAYDPGMRLLGGEGKAKALWKYHRKFDLTGRVCGN